MVSRNAPNSPKSLVHLSAPSLPKVSLSNPVPPQTSQALSSQTAGVSATGSFSTTFFLNSLFFSLSAKPIGCLGPAGASGLWMFPPPPRPVWKFWSSVLGRRATSGIATSSFRFVAGIPGEPILAAPPRPVLKAPSW